MDLFGSWGQSLFSKIDALPIGFEGGLAEIYGDEWSALGTPGRRREYGKQFKAAVIANQIPCLEWTGIANAGRHDLYHKIRGMEK